MKIVHFQNSPKDKKNKIHYNRGRTKILYSEAVFLLLIEVCIRLISNFLFKTFLFFYLY